MKLRGSYALFLAGQTSDEPVMVGNDATWLRKAGIAIWGQGCLVELWETPADRKYALQKLAESRRLGAND